MLNLLNLSVPPNVLLPVPAAAVAAVALPPLLVLGLFVVFLLPVPAAVVVPPPVLVEPFVFLLPVVFFVVVVLFFFTANVEAVILPAVTSAIAVTMTKMANSVVFVRILGFYAAQLLYVLFMSYD
jgi:hypothetical protein